EKTQIDYDRYKRLYENDKAITKNVMEVQESRLKQVQASVAEIIASIDLAKSQLKQARSSLAIANKDWSDSLVVSPISGKVSRRMLEPGEMAGAGTPVLHVDDLSVLEISVYLPGEYYRRIDPGKTNMHIQVGDIDLGQHPVSYKSPTVAPVLRTFEIKCLLSKPAAGVAPGLLAGVTIVLDRREGLGVPSESIQKRAGENVIFIIENDVASMVTVQVGLQMDGMTEIHNAEIPAGASVVSLGQYYLNDGTAVSIVKEVR
ncbi:MAG TPA: efflux RND transporter periplasmic adaptor subunit, partial [Phycisphaerae bacterium]|nr:efflux RND transporter periplasmic adaptor subunit [Phycisphaerae bacterium]